MNGGPLKKDWNDLAKWNERTQSNLLLLVVVAVVDDVDVALLLLLTAPGVGTVAWAAVATATMAVLLLLLLLLLAALLVLLVECVVVVVVVVVPASSFLRFSILLLCDHRQVRDVVGLSRPIKLWQHNAPCGGLQQGQYYKTFLHTLTRRWC